MAQKSRATDAHDRTTDRDCEKCGSGRVVPVYHRRMMGTPHGGNPYRLYCLDCNRFGHAVSKQFFKTHLRPHVLPKDAPLDDPDSVIPMHEWHDPDEFEDVAKRSQDLAERDPDDRRPYLATEANTFYCPDCGAFQLGYPDECHRCGATFRWHSTSHE